MNKIIKSKQKESVPTQGGFLKLIIFIIVVLFLMKYFNISLTDVIDWIKALFNNVF